MDATIWAGTGKKQLGIRVGAVNRARFFSAVWHEVIVEMDGQLCHFKLTPGFWKDCPEFRDGVDAPIRRWLSRHDLLDWPKGMPPRLTLEPLGGNRFHLLRK